MTLVVPMIAGGDGNAAVDWLIEAFGFVEADRRIDAKWMFEEQAGEQ